MVLIAIVGGVASYVDNYYTESVGQWVANDLRMRVYDHLERLSFTYYDTHQTGLLLSTMTDDVATVQDFVSSSTLEHPDRRHDHRRDARPDVLAQLGLHAAGRGDHAVPAAVRRPVQEGGQEGDPRSAAAPERRGRGAAGRSRVDAHGAGLRRAGRRSGAARRGQPGDGEGGAQRAAGQVAPLAGRRAWSSRCAPRSSSGAAPDSSSPAR